jgi:acetyl/propionyl-CoA carboxylase alpha subunit
MTTGIDLAKWQLKIANGDILQLKQKDIIQRGHAIESRIYAENPSNGFLPSIGTLEKVEAPTGPNIRNDTGIYTGMKITPYYDPMLSKLITWGNNRDEAIERSKRALGEYQIAGVKTNINFFYWILENNKFLDLSFDNNFLDNEFIPLVPNRWKEGINEDYKEIAAILGAFLKSSERELKSGEMKCSRDNNWESLKYE